MEPGDYSDESGCDKPEWSWVKRYSNESGCDKLIILYLSTSLDAQ